MVDMLAITIARAKEDDQIKGILPHFIEDGLSLLQYVDDTNIFYAPWYWTNKYEVAPLTFEQLSGLKINFHKSEIFYFGQGKQCEA